ncbi:ABC transporter permease [Nocardiopsis ganjiahuensis]|uniref:ABC transporter permease n=1 Tax=Nocardiopsis ganjiahuensis TaxID=239984 RepID=UPI00034720DE|nr:ABC transporter permease [Nocardiopsis ganjiahuensis]
MGGSSDLLNVGPALAVAIAVAVLAAAGVCVAARLGHGLAVLRAGARAALQLGAVSLVIAAVVSSGPLTLCFVAVMLAVASWTAGRRITPSRRGLWAFLPICVPVVPLVAVLLATGLTPWTGLAVIPLAGILTGGALTATVLAGRRVTEELRTRGGEVDAALSLGMLPREAALEIGRPAASSALLPALDQTRTVGLVTLPGAFVGMLLGGAGPFEAGAVQAFVLAALLLVESVAIVLTLELVARGSIPHTAPA